ncbi:hypothetical protein AURDEDRAFT_181593 [Auricularia subglabra TFB-10046 SS5]|nr:hypothetical protein AURDEDRAFT_181593 [Auricularia subglabra TFB-10046 SS5]
MSESEFDDLFGDLPLPEDALEAPVAPAELNVVLADDTADPDDFIFDGINITQTAALSWAPEDMPDFGSLSRDLTPGSSTPTESSVSTPKDDPAVEAKEADSPLPESIDPRALDINAVLPLPPKEEARPAAPEPHPATPMVGVDVPLPGGRGPHDVPDLGDMEAFFNSLAVPPAPAEPADQFTEMLAMMFALQQQQQQQQHQHQQRGIMGQVAYPPPMPVQMQMGRNMGMPMQFMQPQYYPPGYNMPPYMPPPQEMYWMRPQQQQQPALTGPARTAPRQSRPRPAPYATNPHAQPVAHDAWRNPQHARSHPPANIRQPPANAQNAAPPPPPPNAQNVAPPNAQNALPPNLQGLGPRPTADELLAAAGKPPPKPRKQRVHGPIRDMSQWPAGMPLPGIAPPPPPAAAAVPLPPLPAEAAHA